MMTDNPQVVVYNAPSECTVCEGAGWVCETHNERPWGGVSDSPFACDCGPGIPCAACNLPSENNPPRMAPGFRVMLDKDDGWAS